MISDPMCEPFWTMAEELDFSIGFHEGSTNAMPTVGVDRFEGDRAARHTISHTMEMMLAAMSVIWGGVVDRHPRLRIAFLESGGGWIAPWLDRMDRHFDRSRVLLQAIGGRRRFSIAATTEDGSGVQLGQAIDR